VLILLLVYHFKQRIITVEQKCETMFDIINTMVQEIQYLRVAQQHQPSFPPSSQIPLTQQFKNLNIGPDEESDAESESSSDVGNSGSSSEGDDDSESESSEDEEDEDEVKKIVLLETVEPTSSTSTSTDHDNIKLVNMENEIQLDELPIEQDLDAELESELEELAPISVEESVVVEKVVPLEENVDSSFVETESSVVVEQKDAKEVYNKMSTATLKQLVVQKGLCSDAGKIRRPELLKMLESA